MDLYNKTYELRDVMSVGNHTIDQFSQSTVTIFLCRIGFVVY